jgi:uncharacterized circularly permuted ATP-grasp superfamily protein
VADGPHSWSVLPGGLVRIVGADAEGIASMQRGGSSADAWVLTDIRRDGRPHHPAGSRTCHRRRSRHNASAL